MNNLKNIILFVGNVSIVCFSDMEKKVQELNAASSRAKVLVGLDIQPIVKSKSNEVIT